MSLVDWTRSETVSAPDIITISWTTDATATTPAKEEKKPLPSTTFSTSTSEYWTLGYFDATGKKNIQDVVVYKEDSKRTTKASVNQSWITDRLKRGRGLPSGDDYERSVTKYEYSDSTDGPKLIKETTEVYISMAAFAGQMQGIPYSMVDPLSSRVDDYIYYDPPEGEVLSHRTIVEYEEYKGADGRDYTRTKTSRWIALGQVTEAKESLAKFLKAVSDLGLLTPEIIQDRLDSHTQLKFEGTEVQVYIGRAPVPAKPSDAELAANEVTNGNTSNTSLTPTERYGNDLGWTSFVPEGTDWRSLTGDSNGDGVPDWAPYVPDTWQDYNQDTNNDGTPDWAPYVPGDWRDYVSDTNDWQNTPIDTNNDGVPDWADNTPIGWQEFDTKDTDYSNPDATPNNDKFITGRVVFDGQSFSGADATVTATYEMPFAPDDYFYYEKGIRKLYRSGAQQAAIRFGQCEAALDIGHAYGQNIVTNFDNTPTLDLSPVYVRLAGIEGAFLLDGTSYAWGPEGMVVSSDLMLLGVTGYDGASAPAASWLRLPVATTSIGAASGTTVEASPLKANSIAIPGGFDIRSPGATLAALPTNGVDVFREWKSNAALVPPSLTLETEAIASGPVITALEFSYALTLEADTAALATGPFVDFAWVTMVTPPVAGVGVGGLAPRVATGARVLVPATSVAVAGVAPSVASGASVAVPAAGISVAGVVPELVGRPKTVVEVPVAEVQVAGLVPLVASGASVAVPAASISVAGLAPAQLGVEKDPYFASVSLLLRMDGSNGSTTFTDSSTNAHTITVFGNAQVSTADKKYGTGALTLDGNGDYLQTPANSAFALGTGNFTVECWCKPSVINDNDGLFTFGSLFVALYQGGWYLGASGSGGTGMGAATANTWQHLAVTRSGSSLRLFINGTQLGSTLTDSTNLTQNQLRIGYYFSSEYAFNGLIDEFRVTKGVARYTSNFTAPTAPFPGA